jgi:subtilisin family serine protease
MITPNNKFFNQQWGLRLIKAPEAWKLLNGNAEVINGNPNEIAFGNPDIRIAVIDNGIETKNNIPVFKGLNGNTTNGNSKFLKNIASQAGNASFDFIDFITGSHGQSVSGITTAKPQINNVPIYNGSGIIGVAPNCSLYSITTAGGNVSILYKLLYAHALAGLEYTTTNGISYEIAINDAYGFSTERVNLPKLFKKAGTIDALQRLNFFLNDSFADVFNISIQIVSDPGLRGEQYSKAIFNEISFLGRNGRGCVIVVGAGNNGLDIEPLPNQFLNEMAFSNKPIIVSAVSVDNNYNWIVGSPIPHPKKSSYSNFGNRIDICAPGGGGTMAGQENNLIFSCSVQGEGDLLSNSPLKLNLKAKSLTNVTPITFVGSTTQYYENVVLEFDNVNGVFENQSIVIGNFSSINSYEISKILSVSSNKITIEYLKVTTFNNLVVTTSTPNQVLGTEVEFVPFYTKITNVYPNNKRLIEVENIKGAFSGSDIYIGNLGNTSNGSKKRIVSNGVNISTNQITLSSDVNAQIGDYIVFPSKVCNVVATTVDSITIGSNIEGLFIGAKLSLRDNNNNTIENVVVSKINPIASTSNNQIFFESKFASAPVGVTKAVTVGFGDITSSFNGTSAATPFVSGVAALILSANSNLSSAEVKHILKDTASRSDTVTGVGIPPYSLNSDNYMHSIDYGTGLLDAEAAVQLALDWHTKPTVQKPNLQIADKLSGTNLVTVLDNEVVDSPDILVNTLVNPGPNPSNVFDASIDQRISVKVRNIGNRQSFKECDLRVLIAFTDEVNPAFPFPENWYDKIGVKLLAIKEIPIIPAGGETTVDIEWKDIVKFWNDNNKFPEDPNNGNLLPGGLRKRAYILAHIAPFDGLPNEVRTDNLRHNKQLSCKEIIVTYNGVRDRAAYIQSNNLNITVGTQIVEKSFEYIMENVLASVINNIKIKAIKKNRADNSTEEVIYKKTASGWAIESGTPVWIEFEAPIETASLYLDRKNMKFPYKLKIDEQTAEVKLEVTNT